MDPVASLGRLVLSLGVIVGALLVVRHWAQRGRGAVRGAGGVRVLARTALTRTSVIAVIETDGRRFLVGAAEQDVRLLAELDPDDGEAALAALGGMAGPDAARLAPRRPPTGPQHPVASMDGRTPGTARPRTGLLDRLRASTVRTHVDRPIRVPLR